MRIIKVRTYHLKELKKKSQFFDAYNKARNTMLSIVGDIVNLRSRDILDKLIHDANDLGFGIQKSSVEIHLDNVTPYITLLDVGWLNHLIVSKNKHGKYGIFAKRFVDKINIRVDAFRVEAKTNATAGPYCSTVPGYASINSNKEPTIKSFFSENIQIGSIEERVCRKCSEYLTMTIRGECNCGEDKCNILRSFRQRALNKYQKLILLFATAITKIYDTLMEMQEEKYLEELSKMDDVKFFYNGDVFKEAYYGVQ